MIFKAEFLNEQTPFPEYPRPQFMRNSYFSLNGEWEYAITEKDCPFPDKYDGKIIAPYSPESVKSGVNRQLKADEYLHYKKVFLIPEDFLSRRSILNVGACDQVCEIFVNGRKVARHEGGYLPFSVELTGFLKNGENEIKIRVEDDASSCVYGRGKQNYKNGGIWYTAISGIWQTIWLEAVPDKFIAKAGITPLFDEKKLEVIPVTDGDISVLVEVYDGDEVIASASGRSGEKIILDVGKCSEWTCEDPQLYTVIMTAGEDKVKSYFGMRKFSLVTVKGKKYFALNNKPIYHNGLLDQGYWKDGIYTPDSNEAMYSEIKRVKDLGFNMLRKHIKTEPYLWYYYCDILGVLVWQDMINGGGEYSRLRINLCPFINLHINDKNYKRMKRDDPRSREQYMKEAEELIGTLYNCVSLCLWTPFNEAWGQFDAKEVCEKLKKKDPSRLFDHASGWQDKGGGDVFSRHIYFRKARMKNDKKRALALTEFGGYSFPLEGHTFTSKKFGYKTFKDKEAYSRAFVKLYENEIIPEIKNKGLCGSVYTQLTDVEEEINGIFTFDRILKLNEEEVKEMNKKVYEAFEKSLK